MTLAGFGRALLAFVLAFAAPLALEPAVPQETKGSAPTAVSVSELLKGGRYGEAEAAARALLEQAQTADGDDSESVAGAMDLLVEALWRGGKGAQPEARALAERALGIRERLLGPDHPQLAPSLTKLGWVLEERGELAAAEALYRRELAIQERAFGPTHKDIAQTLVNLGNARRTAGDFPAARAYYERALQILEQLWGPEHRSVGFVVNNLAVVAQEMGDHGRARELLARALGILDRSLGPDDVSVAMILNNIAGEHEDEGDFATARAEHARALGILEKRLGVDHPQVAAASNNLAVALTNLGDYTEAKRLFERSLSICENAGQAETLDCSSTVLSLGSLLDYMGDHEGARQRYEQALALRERLFGDEHPSVALVQFALGKLRVAEGDDRGAENLLDRAFSTQQKALGPEHERLVGTLEELGGIALRRGEHERARQLIDRALAIIEKRFGPGHALLTTPLQQLARVAEQEGDLGEARAALERALEIYRQSWGPGHPFTAEATGELAVLLAKSGERRRALEMALQTERLSRDHFRITVQSLGERQALLYGKGRASGIDLALTLLGEPAASPADRRAVFDAVVRSRALVLDEMCARHRSAAAGGSELAEPFAALALARERLARIVVRGPGSGTVESYRRLIDQAVRDKEAAEEALAAKSLAYRDERTRSAIGLDGVERALPAGTTLVAFVRYEQRLAPGSPKEKPRPADRYAVFVLRAGRDPELLSLGPAKPIDDAINRWQRALRWEARAPGVAPRRSLKRYALAAAALRRLTWDPITPSLAGADSVFLVPDGPLHLVNFAALTRDDGSFLIEAGPLLHVLSAERDLVPGSRAAAGQGLLLLGAPAFASGRVRAAQRGFRGATASCEGFQRLRFSALPGARRELAAIDALWKGSSELKGEASSVVMLVGDRADEAAFKDLAAGRRVIHLATHGFTLGAGCALASPLLRSGLALAGANRRRRAEPEVEDGILTAEEVAGLDLRGVEWAVLSACETGGGELATGEGVLGLRRAFQVAGARSVITSLWPVDDASARAWMESLYLRRLRDRLSTAEAARRASLDGLQERRRRGESPHPLYWAGFVAAGDWR